jgi:hypothetical protein
MKAAVGCLSVGVVQGPSGEDLDLAFDQHQHCFGCQRDPVEMDIV